jgi:hypothetical protein
MTLLHIGDQIFNSETIAVVRPIDDEHCTIFTVGQSAIDGGFLINLSADEVEAELSKVDRNVLLDLVDRIQDEYSENGKNGDGKKDGSAGPERKLAGHSRRRG